ncbi:slo-interacting protein 1-like isoform X2 [Teleopsis dalmanni]|uniref:slo-interacting protein 1-like isoform X2 n=2 Tax=Teleopsis dalmanni TaxID=139649 RepID=UPI0018CF9378|nr:slo-interacting protein 1-like isoform X2 [Teleopsis dalmanni]
METMDDINFVVLKINGVCVNNLTHDETSKMFLNTDGDKSVCIEVRQRCGTPFEKLYNKSQKPENIFKDVRDLEINAPQKFDEIKDNINVSDVTQMHNENSFSVLNNIILTLKPLSLNLDIKSDSITYVSKYTQTEESKSLPDINIQDQKQSIIEQCMAPEIYIEEITLRKSECNECLGITVCCPRYDNNCSDINSGIYELEEGGTLANVYISNIHHDSIANRDGRLRQGDLLLQVNGKDVKSKSEAEVLIAENNNAVTLLVSRCIYTDNIEIHNQILDTEEDEGEEYDGNNDEEEDDDNNDDDDDDDDDEDDDDDYDDEYIYGDNIVYENNFITNDYINVVDGLNKVILVDSITKSKANNLRKVDMQSDCNETVKRNSVESECNEFVIPSVSKSNKIMLVKDSVKSSVDYETEHIYETIPEDSESEPFYCSPYESPSYITSINSYSSATESTKLQQKQRVCQWLGIKPFNSLTTAQQSMRISNINSSETTTSRAVSNKSNSFHSALTAVTNKSFNSEGGCGKCSINNYSQVGIKCGEDVDNSSSAYNTGGSNNSTSTTNLLFCQDQNNRVDPTNLENCQLADVQSSKLHRLPSPKESSTKNKSRVVLSRYDTSEGTITQSFGLTEPSKDNNRSQLLNSTMYTNKSNISQTMLLQQHLFRQSERSSNQQNQIFYTQFTAPNLSQYHFVSSQEVSNAQHLQKPPTASSTLVVTSSPQSDEMVWKVKRRQDGTRYIVRRPARRHFLHDRPSKNNTEIIKTDFTTTEDDTISEVKTGRYWSREDRKKHVEQARERRQQHRNLIRTPTSATLLSTIRINDKNNIKFHHTQSVGNAHNSKLILGQSNKSIHCQNANKSNENDQSQSNCIQSELDPKQTSLFTKISNTNNFCF